MYIYIYICYIFLLLSLSLLYKYASTLQIGGEQKKTKGLLNGTLSHPFGSGPGIYIYIYVFFPGLVTHNFPCVEWKIMSQICVPKFANIFIDLGVLKSYERLKNKI